MSTGINVKYHHYEVRRPTFPQEEIPERYKNDWDIVKWDEHFNSCWSIAHLHWNPKEISYELESVGMRLLDECIEDDGLAAFIKSWTEFVEYLQRLEQNYE